MPRFSAWTWPKGGHAPARARLLCVEDNPFGRVILNTILTELGHHPEFVGRGETVCDRLTAGDIDAVLMDISCCPASMAWKPFAASAPCRRRRGRCLSSAYPDAARTRRRRARLVPMRFWLKPVSPRALAVLLAEVGAGASRPP